ncbi:hypothetical protein H6F78_05555 [Coleofasciculus sp. FACHB-64]|uniref:hypothetical protein n=1 Tax=Cyanophyceae TaxID=3028117 RepID=UPI0016837BF5|nr:MULTISPECIES: hypothetical protein [unclassified Coleofasciculus]MBD1881570.1 hypothetical protein [Coleofasciculus sp. FACHB-T130]MBD1902895.1 hypothetical protein [Coleofasciculus sp. FACHB-125]MBD2045068.1 hypothetical protein [Coleofasciculus sp. FACHB-64]MBD2083738.1 hypothetical protein [Coleofasciculus sp. FACHB-542]
MTLLPARGLFSVRSFRNERSQAWISSSSIEIFCLPTVISSESIGFLPIPY